MWRQWTMDERREIGQAFAERYCKARNRKEKSRILDKMVSLLRGRGAHFRVGPADPTGNQQSEGPLTIRNIPKGPDGPCK